MIRITTLAENLTYQRGLISEHGLSLLIEVNGKKILFDTGQGYALMHNAGQLGVDLAEVDDIVISHGHYDHTGGLANVLNVNRKATVYLKEEAFSDKLKRLALSNQETDETNSNGAKAPKEQKKRKRQAELKGKTKFIGMDPSDRKILERSHLLKEPMEIEKDVFVMTDIPVENNADTGFSGFITGNDEDYQPDEFLDEQYLVVLRNKKICVFSGCSHRGISNILSAAVKHFRLPVALVLGGFHLSNCTEEQYRTVADSLNEYDPESIGVCHCTGVEAYYRLRQDCGDAVFYNPCGNRIHLA